MNLDTLHTTADIEAAADPVVMVSPETGLSFEETTELFTTLWLGFLGQWGPPRGTRGRRQHCWRLQIMVVTMETIAKPYDGGDDPDSEVPQRWQDFLNNLPGFLDYWASPSKWAAHGVP
jgi:hypothetical protein